MAYKIIRFYFNNYPTRRIKTNLTLEEAQAHCRDPETSSRTACKPAGVARTNRYGHWFDGYTEVTDDRNT